MALATAAGEALLRATRPPAVGFHHQPCLYWTDAEWGYRYRPNAEGRKHHQFEMDTTVRTNALGFHDVEHPTLRQDEALQVVALGDSFTASLHVPLEQGWTRLLEAHLESRLGRPARVVNLGLDGTGSDVHLSVLERMLPRLRPDIVLLAFFANDIEELERGPVKRECFQGYVVNYQDEAQRRELRRVVEEHAPGERQRWLFEHVYLLRLVSGVFGSETSALLRENYLSPSRFGVPVGEAAAARPTPAAVFERFLELAGEHGFEFVVMTVPPKQGSAGSLATLRAALPEDLLARLDLAEPTAVMARTMQREGLAPADLYWIHDAHFDADGNRVFAEAVADLLAARLGGE